MIRRLLFFRDFMDPTDIKVVDADFESSAGHPGNLILARRQGLNNPVNYGFRLNGDYKVPVVPAWDLWIPDKDMHDITAFLINHPKIHELIVEPKV
jgi:hypothetical protein